MRASERAASARVGTRRSARAAARLALFALVLQLFAPALHAGALGADVVGGSRSTSISGGSGDFAHHVSHSCPICATAVQRSHALAPDLAARPFAHGAGERLAQLAPAPAPAAPQRSSEARAPPIASLFANT